MYKRQKDRCKALAEIERYQNKEDEASKKACVDAQLALVDLSHPGEETIMRTADDAWKKGISWSWKEDYKTKESVETLKTNWKAHPRQMLTARAVTEGVRLINPGLVAGIYEEDEVRDIIEAEVIATTPADPKARDRAAIEAIIAQHQESARCV